MYYLQTQQKVIKLKGKHFGNPFERYKNNFLVSFLNLVSKLLKLVSKPVVKPRTRQKL